MIQPLIDHLTKRFKEAPLPETFHAVDEIMVAFKDHGLKRYMPKKPTKWVYKLWSRASVSGYVYDFELARSAIANGGPASVCRAWSSCT